MAEETVDYSALPLEERLTHKMWKVRLGAYNDLTAELKQLDPDTQAGKFNIYESYLPKIVVDTNMAAQEAGISTIIAFVDNAPNPVRRREEIVSGIVTKCLSSNKAGTRTQSLELLMVLSEVDTPGPVIAGLMEGFDAKQPKSVAASVSAIKDVVHAYGIKHINLKLLLKALVKPFGHKDNNVRNETQLLAVELYRWLGQALLPSLQDLQPVLLKELETQFAKVASDPRPKQTRLLRSQQEAEEAAADAGAGAGGGEDADMADADADDDDTPADIDPWDITDPVDITKKLPEDFYTFLASKKWKERKQVVEELYETVKKSIRLQLSSSTGDVIQEVSKKIGDTNIIVATLVIQLLGQFSSALRTAFAPYAQASLPALLEKLKERKQSVIDTIRETMDFYFKSLKLDLSSIGDHYFTGATHKNPQVRAESHHFLRRCFAIIPTRPGKGDIKRYADQLKAGLDDGDSGVREAAAECLGTLSKLVTSKVLEPFIEGIDKIKMEKVNEYAEKATVKAKAPRPKPAAAPKPKGPPARAKPRPRPAAAPAPAPAAEEPEEAKPAGLSANLPPHIRKKLEASARAAALKKAQREGKTLDDLPPAAEPTPPPPPAAAPRPAAARPAVPPKKPAAAPRKPPATAGAKPGARTAKPGAAASKDTSDAVKMRFANDESLDEKIAEAIPAEILTNFESAKWKDRVEAMDSLKAHLEEQAASGSAVHPELVIRQFSRKPGWKESNFQVNSRAFQIIEWMAQETSSVEFTTGAASLCVPALVDKLGDIKLKTPAGGALVAIAERFSLRFLLGLASEPIKSQKSPKVLADCLAWLDTQLVEFGIKGLALRPIVDMVKEVGLQSSNAQTRTKAVSFMGTIRRGVGPAVMDLMDDLNPQLMQLLEAEFEKVADQSLPEPVRTQGGLSGAGTSGGVGGGGQQSAGADAAQGDAMDDLFPRQDLHALIGPAIYRQLGDANWKERKAAMDAIQGALDSTNHRILPSISADLYTALKQRLQDSNKNLVTVALGLLGALSTDSGASQVANIRIVALPTIQCMADKKPQLRAAAVSALTAWADATPAIVEQAILPTVPTALADTSPELRSSLLLWAADTLGPRHAKGARLPDMSSLITPLFSCLQDRNSDVRKQAHRVLELTVASCGFEAVYDACNSQLRGASKTTVAPMIEELRHTITTAGVQPKAGAAGGTGGVRGGARLGAGIGASDRAPSPAVEPVMTASELIGRSTNRAAGTPPQPQLAAPASSAVGAQGGAGQGMLRRPMAVRRPAGATSTIAAMRQARPARAPPASAESSRPGSSLRSATPTQASAASQLARLSNEELEAIPPILDSDVRAKEQRARRDMAANPHGMPRWMQLGDARVRADLESQLSEQMAAHVNPLFHRQLFSTGHYKDRDYLSGLSSIEEVISINGLSQQRFRIPLYADSSMPDEDSLASRYLANIDLLLKYISIRMFDGSTHTLLKSFDLLERLIQITEQSQQQSQQTASWSDYDVQAVLPALISRLGDAKEVVRARSRRVLTQSVTHLYPATKIFTMLLEHGVTNKSNARIRQESLDCICFLIRERTAGLGLGAVCAQPARAVPIIAQGVADRDSNVRTATLNVLVAVGEQLQGGADELWRLCGRMAEKERTMLEEKLKRSTIGAGSAASSSGTLQGNGDAFAQRPGSRAGLAGQLGGAGAAASARSRLSQYGAPAGPGIGAGLRSAGPGIGRPGFGAGAGAAAAAAGAVAGSGMVRGTAGIGNRLARPPQSVSSMPQPGEGDSGLDYGQQPQAFGARAHSGSAAGASSDGRPMFSLDFDKLNLPSYSAATAEQISNTARTSAAASAGAHGVGAPLSQSSVDYQPRGSYYESEHSAIGYGAGRSDSLKNALAGLHISMDSSSAAANTSSMPMARSAGAGRIASMPFSTGAMRGPVDFSSMNEPEREQWMEGIIADLSGDDSKAAEKAIERLQTILDSIEKPTVANVDPSLALAQLSPALAHIRKNIGNIISAISMQLRWAYTTTSTDPSMQSPIQVTLGRIRKTTLGLLIDIFSDPRLALWVSQDAMQTLLEELIRRLVDPMLKQSSRLRGSAPGAGAGRGMIANAEQLSKAINTIVIKILDKADRTTVYVSLIQMLESSLAEPAPNPPQSDADVVRMDFGDMVMRCLWRLTKPLPMELQAQFARVVESGAASVPADIANPRFGDPRYHQQIRIDPVLRMAHRFFVHVPDREWRKREDRDKWMYGDLPKRTVKTITHSFITVLRGLIWQFTGLIIRDVMEEHPGLLSAPPPAASSSSAQQLESDPALTSWVDDSHAKLVRASETWSYLHTTLEMADPRISKPTASQFMAAMHIAQTAREDDASDDEQDAVMASSPLQASYQPAASRPHTSSRPASVVSSSSSPYMRQSNEANTASSPGQRSSISSSGYNNANRVSRLYPTSTGSVSSSPHFGTTATATATARATSPLRSPTQRHSVFGAASVGNGSSSSGPGGDDRSSQDRLNALRQRILGSQSAAQNQHSRISQQPQNAGASNSAPNMDDIRAKIARMRSSLRNQK